MLLGTGATLAGGAGVEAVATLDVAVADASGALEALGEGGAGVQDQTAERRSAMVPAVRALNMAPMVNEPRARAITTAIASVGCKARVVTTFLAP